MSRKDTDFPVFLFHEGNNCEAYKLFSPHPVKVKGKEGWLVLWRWLVCRAGAEDGIMVGYKCMEQ